MVNQKKKSQVDNLTNDLKSTVNVLIFKIDKTTHQNLESLRKEMRKVNAKVRVVKNSFLEKAVNKMSVEDKKYAELSKKFFPLTGTSALVLLDKTWDKSLKVFNDFLKKESTISYKLSLLDNSVYGGDETANIARLPSKEELLGKIIGSMKSPTSKFVYALKYNTNKFVYILKSKR